jgi:hypothetical protein
MIELDHTREFKMYCNNIISYSKEMYLFQQLYEALFPKTTPGWLEGSQGVDWKRVRFGLTVHLTPPPSHPCGLCWSWGGGVGGSQRKVKGTVISVC